MPTTRTKRRIAPKYGPIVIDGDEWSVRLNPPIATYADLQSGEIDRIIAAARGLIAEHPYVDDDDQPLDVGAWPIDVVTDFVKGYGALMTALPPA